MEVEVIYNQDCLIGMQKIPEKSIDLILCDLPYGTTRNKWDSVIPFADLWKHYNRIVKENAAIILFADGIFTARLVQSNVQLWRYNLVWDKQRGSDFLNAHIKPLKCHEDIVVFYKKKPVYNKQYWYSKPYKPYKSGPRSINYGNYNSVLSENTDGKRNPLTILSFPKDTKKLHPTQKPVALLEYLIKTFSNEGGIVLDNCFGSGSTLIAAVNTGRRYIGFEIDPCYFDIACRRLDEIERGG